MSVSSEATTSSSNNECENQKGEAGPPNADGAVVISERDTGIMTGAPAPKPEIEYNDGYKAVIKWAHQDRDTAYAVRWFYEKECLGNITTSKPEFTLPPLMPGREYRVEVQDRDQVAVNNEVVPGYVTLNSAPMLVQDVRAVYVTGTPDHAITVMFNDPDPRPKTYTVHLVHAGTGDEESHAEMTKTFHTFRGLDAGVAYEVYVEAELDGLRIRSKKAYAPSEIKTHPSKVKGIKIAEHTGDVIKLTWDATDGAASYEIKLDCHGEDSEILLTEETTIELENLSAGRIHFVRITGINESGRGAVSERLKINAVPSAPTNVQAQHLQRSPESIVLVTFEDTNRGGKKHIVYAKPLGANEDPIRMETQDQRAVVRELLPGESYEIGVETQQGGLTSKKTMSESPILMYPCKPVGLDAAIKNKLLQIQWNHLAIRPQSYMVEIRVKDRVMKEYTEKNVLTKRDLMPSSVYEISVAAMNEAGTGKMTDAVAAVTDPAPPECPRVRRNPSSPTKSLIVSFADPDTAEKSYKIIADPTNGDDPIERTTTQKYVTINGLKPGQRYVVDVISVMGEKISEPVRCIPQEESPRTTVCE